MSPISKQLFRELFGPRPPRSLFIPWLWRYAARLEQISLESMVRSPDLLSQALVNAWKLFQYDAIVACFDDTLEAEACGCFVLWENGEPVIGDHPLSSDGAPAAMPEIETRGRLPVIVEAIKRMTATAGREVPVVAGITGPLTLARRLAGIESHDVLAGSKSGSKILDFAGRAAVRLARAYCEAGADAIALIEPGLSDLPAGEVDKLKPVVAPVANVVRFYSARTILLVRSVSGIESARAVIRLGLDAISPGASGRVFTEATGPAAPDFIGALGFPLPEAAFRGDDIAPALAAAWQTTPVKRSFLTTEWEVPVDIPPETLHRIIREWRMMTGACPHETKM